MESGIKYGYGECEARRAESGGGVLGDGAVSPSSPARRSKGAL